MPRLFDYVSYRVRDKATAEELTAAICERALIRLHQYDPDRGTFYAWIFGIAHNMIWDYYQQMRRRPTVLALDDLPDVQVESESPEEIYEIREVFRRVMRHLHRLSDAEQEVMALCYGAGLSNVEIARITELTPNHVGVLRHRALKKLRQAVPYGEEVTDA